MVFYTENSAYEVDLVGRRVRRLRGEKDPSPRIGQDGKWREYAMISPIQSGLPVLIRWTSAVKCEPGFIPHTLTSPVKRVSGVEN